MSRHKNAPKPEPAENPPEISPDEAVGSEPAEDLGPQKEEPAENERETALEAELAAEKDRFLRLAAEYDNYRKRSVKERENIYTDVRGDTVKKFLPVYDDLSRACAQETEDEAYRKGVEMILSKIVDIMEKFGVVGIDTADKKFDPLLHDAVLHVEDESLGEEVIVEELQKGFMMGDKVIRFSSVKVAN